MSSKISKEQLLMIATEMYETDGTIFSEHYSRAAWEKRGWPEADDDLVYKILDAHIKFLRSLDEYNGKISESPFKRRDILGRIKRD